MANDLPKSIPAIGSIHSCTSYPTYQLGERIRRVTRSEWDPALGDEKKALVGLKGAITKDALLWHCNYRKPTLIESDASGSGLGAVLLQKGRPVFYAYSRLMDTEKSYHPL